jgi:tetratricopeptide (TPR) repeat protein
VTDDQTLLGDPNRPLRHRAFFAAASEHKEGSHEYRQLLAGLLVLRLLDKWPKPSDATPEENEVRIALFVPVKNAVEAIEESPVKRVLANLIEAISTFSYGGRDGRLKQLIVYAQFLEREKRWEPAADVYGTAVDLINATGQNSDLVLMCYDRSAYCLREAGQRVHPHELLSTGIEIATNQRNQSARQHDDGAIERIDYWLERMRIAIATLAAQMLEERKEWESAAAIYAGAIDLKKTRPTDRGQLPTWYERAAYCFRQVGEISRAREMLNDGIEVARELHDLPKVLYLRISDAVVERQTGDLPQAEFQLAAIMEEAKSAGQHEMLARATHERGVVAHERRQYAQAAEYHREAAGLYGEQRMVRRALTDLAVSLGELGHHDYAMKVLRAVWRAPETEAEPRDIAGLNLMRGAFLADRRDTFDDMRRQLDPKQMSGRLGAHYWLFAGQGFHHFGDLDSARAAIEEAIRLAEHFAVYKLLTEAKAVLSAIDDRPVPWREPEESPTLAALFAEIDEGRGMFEGAIAA